VRGEGEDEGEGEGEGVWRVGLASLVRPLERVCLGDQGVVGEIGKEGVLGSFWRGSWCSVCFSIEPAFYHGVSFCPERERGALKHE